MTDDAQRSASAGELHEDLFDAYVEAALKGDVQDPAEFCARHGVEASALEEWLSALSGMLGPGARPQPGRVEGDLPFERLGEFRLVRRLGEGGMGVVYLAEQESLGRLVALKVVRPEWVGSVNAELRFRREAAAIARLQHPGIVSIIAVGVEQGVSFLVMELVPGRSLEEIFTESRRAGESLPVPRLLRWMIEVSDALDAAHREGIVHRDVKPSNIRITPAGRAKLIDFGLARAIDASAPSVTGPFAGSPSYASPEQVDTRRRAIDARTDIYSAGVVLYEGLAGRVPFAAESIERVFHAILVSEPEPLRRVNPAVARDLEVVVSKAMEKSSERRYREASELRDDLRAVLELRPIKARPPRRLQRVAKWCRRNRVAATALGFAAAAAAVVGWVVVDQARRDERRRAEEAALLAQARREANREARALVDGAMEQLRSFASAVDRAIEASQVSAGFYRQQQWYHLKPDELEGQQRADAFKAAYPLERERVYGEVLRRVSQAQELDPSVAVSDVLAYLYRQRCHEAVSLQQWDLARFYRDLLEDVDRNRRYDMRVDINGVLSVDIQPHDAEVHLFRYEPVEDRTRGGERRLMAVPLRGALAEVPPGSHVLRVTGAAGDLATSDLIVEVLGQPVSGSVFVATSSGDVAPLSRLVSIDGVLASDRYTAERCGEDAAPREFVFAGPGGDREVVARGLGELGVTLASAREVVERGDVPIVAWTGGQLREMIAPRGLVVRETTSPCPLGSNSRLDGAPGGQHLLDFGRYLAVLHRDGYEDQRVSFQVTFEARIELRPVLHPAATSRPGMTYVACDAQFRDHPGYWIMDREVTCAEYLEFLNDPATRAEIAAAATPIRVPRDSLDASVSAAWPRTEEGLFSLPRGWRDDFPVMGVSWDDARAFVEWKRRRDSNIPDGYEWALPDFHEWIQAGTGGGILSYMHGEAFRPQWVKSRFARPDVARESVLSFPIDESPFGVYDMLGGAAEWLESHAFGSRHSDRAIAGGSWQNSAPDDFRLDGHRGAPPDQARGHYGFRLTWAPKENRR